jgi:hypothetical protein
LKLRERPEIAKPPALALWVPQTIIDVDRQCLPARIERQVIPLLSRLERDLKGCQPHLASLNLSLVSLVAMGLDLSPTAQECAILGFQRKNTKLKEYTPCVMRAGLRRIAAEVYPLGQFKAQVVVCGDQWRHWWDERGEHIEWCAGEKRASVVKSQGGLDYAGILAAFCWIPVRGQDPILGVLEGEELREKLRANRNIKGAGLQSAWGAHPTAMIEKTVEKWTLRQLPLSGRPGASLRWDSLAEARKLRELGQELQEDAQARELPTEAVELLQVGDEEEEDLSPETDLNRLRTEWERDLTK